MVTVLLVEDEKQILNHLEALVKASFIDMQILKAQTFQEAKVIIESGIAEIFVIDFGLPDGDGLDLIKLIRTHYSRQQPIIIQTKRDDKAYQLDIYKQYGNIVYLTRDTVFKELVEHIANAREDVKDQLNNRLMIPGKTIFEALDKREICFISKLPNCNNLEVTSYDVKTEDFKYKEIVEMSLSKFLELYNESNTFIRCHRSYVINKKMVEKILRTESKILLRYKNVKIELGESYKKDILQSMKGVF